MGIYYGIWLCTGKYTNKDTAKVHKKIELPEYSVYNVNRHINFNANETEQQRQAVEYYIQLAGIVLEDSNDIDVFLKINMVCTLDSPPSSDWHYTLLKKNVTF